MPELRSDFETRMVRFADRPELWRETAEVSEEVWPEYNLHGDVLNPNWSRLFDAFPQFQFALVEPATDVVVAEGHTAPCCWDGTDEGLGSGIDEMLLSALAHALPPTALCALAAEIKPRYQGHGLASRVLETMAGLAREAGLAHLIAPVRPSLKERYPITAIERYVRWRRADGQPFDPWIRTHTRFGGVVRRPAPQSMRITGSVAEWEQWTGLRFPEDGSYVFPRGLAPVTIDRGRDVGSYWEPNVWVVHAIPR